MAAWIRRSALVVLVGGLVRAGPPTGGQSVEMISLAADHPEARCLDGSPYAIYVKQGSASAFAIGIHGGGWCYDEASCANRSRTALGTSTLWNSTRCWGPPAFSCYGLAANCTEVFLPYCDGSSFTSNREAVWPVPNSSTVLHLRGRANLDGALDVLLERYGLGEAADVILAGGSAGGLSTILNLDHVASRLPRARVYGAPVAGYFLDHPPMPGGAYALPRPFPGNVEYMFAMFNATGSLNPACQLEHASAPWRCMMAPYAQAFVHTPFFAIQSRFDQFQLGPGIAGVPCLVGQAFAPPYRTDPAHTCNTTERQYIVQYGADFMAQFAPVLNSTVHGCFLVSCIQHGITAELLFNGAALGSVDALTAWRTRADLGRDVGYHFVDGCGDHGDTPCNGGTGCAPF